MKKEQSPQPLPTPTSVVIHRNHPSGTLAITEIYRNGVRLISTTFPTLEAFDYYLCIVLNLRKTQP